MKYVKLFESYQSQKELEKLTSDILKKINTSIFSDLENSSKLNYRKVLLGDIDNSNYTDIKDFLVSNKDLEVCPLPSIEFKKYVPQGASALYMGTKNKESGDIRRLILLNLSNNLISDIVDYIEDYGTEKAYLKSEEKINISLSTDLLHELTHAYDDWRTKGNFKKYDAHNVDVKTYANIPFEVDARFSEAIKKTKFYRDDFEARFTYDLFRDEIVYEMIPFEEVLEEFMKNLEYKTHLNEEQRKRIMRRFGQYYEKEKEFVLNHNTEILKNKETVK